MNIISRLIFRPSSRHLSCRFVREIAVALPLEREIVINCTLYVFCDCRWEVFAAVAANGQCDLHQHARVVHCAQGANGLEAVAGLLQSGKCAVPPIKSTDVRVDFLELA